MGGKLGNAGWVVCDEAAREIGTVHPETRDPCRPAGGSRWTESSSVLASAWYCGSGRLNAVVLAPRGSVGIPVRSVAFSGGHLRLTGQLRI